MVNSVNGRHPLKRKELAAALGISRQMVHKLAQQGMSTDSVDAARTWRDSTLRQHMTKSQRVGVVRATDADPVARVHALWPIAAAALCAGRFDLIENELRAAMRAIPLAARSRVHLDADVMDRLTQHLYAAIFGTGPAASTGAAELKSDAEADEMGDFWYAVAAGESIAGGAS